MRFAVHWPASAVASPRFHGVPRRNVPGRVYVGVTGELAGHASKEGLALAALRCDVPARAAPLRRVRGWYFLDSPRCFVFQATNQDSPARPLNAPVQAALLRHVSTRLVNSALRGAGHRLDLQVLDADHVEASREASAGLLCPVPAPVGLPRHHARDLRPGPGAVGRSAPGVCQLALQANQSGLLAWSKAGAAKEFPGRQGRTDGHAPIDADDRARFRCWNRPRDMGERDVPAAHAVPCKTEGPHAVWHRARQSEPHPSCLRNLDLGAVAVQLPHVTGTDRNDAEPLVPVGLTPRRSAANASEEVLHGLAVIPDRLLLNDHGPGGEPWIIGSGLGQLPTAFGEAGHLPPSRSPFVFLLDAQVPHVSRVHTVSQQYGLLFGSWLESVPGHTKIVAANTGQEDVMPKIWPCHVRLRFSPRSEVRGVQWRLL